MCRSCDIRDFDAPADARYIDLTVNTFNLEAAAESVDDQLNPSRNLENSAHPFAAMIVTKHVKKPATLFFLSADRKLLRRMFYDHLAIFEALPIPSTPHEVKLCRTTGLVVPSSPPRGFSNPTTSSFP